MQLLLAGKPPKPKTPKPATWPNPQSHSPMVLEQRGGGGGRWRDRPGGGRGGYLEDPTGSGGGPDRQRRWTPHFGPPTSAMAWRSAPTLSPTRRRFYRGGEAVAGGGVAVRYLRRMNGGHRDGDLPATLSPATGQRSVCWRASAIARARRLFSRRSRAHICAGDRARANISAGDRAHFGDRAQTFQPASSAIYNMCIASFLHCGRQ